MIKKADESRSTDRAPGSVNHAAYGFDISFDGLELYLALSDDYTTVAADCQDRGKVLWCIRPDPVIGYRRLDVGFYAAEIKTVLMARPAASGFAVATELSNCYDIRVDHWVLDRWLVDHRAALLERPIAFETAP